VEFSNGNSAFAPLKTATHTLESWGEKILGDIAAENYLQGLKKAAFVGRLTQHYGELRKMKKGAHVYNGYPYNLIEDEPHGSARRGL
jgi:hypothetical protein